jgi:hypothetical protein
VTINPAHVSLTRIQVREEAVNAVAAGYYDSVLGWDGMAHPPTAWLTPDAGNNGFVDTVGTNPPGSPGPFSLGVFVWPIPQSYRVNGGAGVVYSTGTHSQVMIGSSGAETTAKEGASRSRTP